MEMRCKQQQQLDVQWQKNEALMGTKIGLHKKLCELQVTKNALRGF